MSRRVARFPNGRARAFDPFHTPNESRNLGGFSAALVAILLSQVMGATDVAGLDVPALPPIERGAPLPMLSGVSILAVDDNRDALEVLKAALSPQGGRLRVAGSGDEAIRELEADPADVLLCDLAMPVLNGFDVLSAVRHQDALRGRRTIAIALTAQASDTQRSESLKAGFDVHVSKPFDVVNLIRTIAAALGKSGQPTRTR